MPKKHSELEKRDAMDLLDIHDDISVVHMLTGIPRRTLRRWRAEARRKQKRYMAEKQFASATKRPQTGDPVLAIEESPHTRSAPDSKPAHANAFPNLSEKEQKDLATLQHIRDKLMHFARRLSDDLDPDDPDVNLRTLSLTRVLDRIYWFEEHLYDGENEEPETSAAEQPNRIEYVYDGAVREHPPWHDASE